MNNPDVTEKLKTPATSAPASGCASWDEEDEWPGEAEEYNCYDCHDTGKVVAMDGYHEYLGYDYVPCHCSAAWRWIGQLCPGKKPCDC